MDPVDFVALGNFILRLKDAGAVQISTPACQVVFMPEDPPDSGFPELVSREKPDAYADDPLFVEKREDPFEGG